MLKTLEYSNMRFNSWRVIVNMTFKFGICRKQRIFFWRAERLLVSQKGRSFLKLAICSKVQCLHFCVNDVLWSSENELPFISARGRRKRTQNFNQRRSRQFRLRVWLEDCLLFWGFLWTVFVLVWTYVKETNVCSRIYFPRLQIHPFWLRRRPRSMQQAQGFSGIRNTTTITSPSISL